MMYLYRVSLRVSTYCSLAHCCSGRRTSHMQEQKQLGREDVCQDDKVNDGGYDCDGAKAGLIFCWYIALFDDASRPPSGGSVLLIVYPSIKSPEYWFYGIVNMKNIVKMSLLLRLQGSCSRFAACPNDSFGDWGHYYRSPMPPSAHLNSKPSRGVRPADRYHVCLEAAK